eukprot:Em0002g448a
MEFDNHTVGSLLYSSHEHSAQVYVALGIIHLVIVVIPSLLIVPVVLYYIYRIMKKSGVKPVILLYVVVAVLCFTGPLISIVTDAGTIANVPVYGNCSSPYLTSPFRFLLNYGMHTTILSTITLISAVQFAMLYFKFHITIKLVCSVLLFLVVCSFAVHCIRFNGTYREIWGPFCTQEGEIVMISDNFLLVVGFIIPLIITVTFSVLACLKTKNSTVHTAGNSAARSVGMLNIVNIICYVALRVPGLVVYFLGKELSETEQQETLDELVVIGQYIGDLSYPLTALSILILHSDIRRMAFSCGDKKKTDTLTTEILSKQSTL